MLLPEVHTRWRYRGLVPSAAAELCRSMLPVPHEACASSSTGRAAAASSTGAGMLTLRRPPPAPWQVPHGRQEASYARVCSTP
jgi:hypothetical protein